MRFATFRKAGRSAPPQSSTASTAAGQPSRRSARVLAVALAGALSLAVAMGIGRFAFTPLLPMMLADRVIDLEAGSWLATVNYVGYLVGALACTALSWAWTRHARLPRPSSSALVCGALAATIVLTLGMALRLPALWPTLRFLAGVASAFAFVFTSGWCLARLAVLGAPNLGGIIYTGPGIGITLSGLVASAMVAAHWSAAAGWLVFGLLAVLLTALAWPTFREPGEARPAPGVGARSGILAATDDRPEAGGLEMALFTVAYGLAGFGYIVTATFLPVIAREALPGSAWLDLFWPIFGVGVIAGALLSTRIPVSIDARYLLTACYAVQALGVMTSLWWPSPAGFALGSLLVGLPFTAISFFGMQEARRLRPSSTAGFMGLLVAAYGLGQIVGPPLVAALLRRSQTTAEGFTLSLQVAAAALAGGAALYLAMSRAYPRSGLAGAGSTP